MSFDRRVAVQDSSQISKILYSIQKETLLVEFKTGTTYMYEEVPASVFGALVAAQSVGGYFAKNVRSKYNYKLIG